jgi:opacity protein-like surface antigen
MGDKIDQERSTMKKRSVMLCLVMTLSLFAINPMLAAAETFWGVYFGTSFINADDTDIKLNGAAISSGDDSETYAVIGLRYGTWFDKVPRLGVALDFTMNGAITGSELEPFTMIWSGSAVAMLRFPLMKSTDFPQGRLQPYLAVGPGFLLTEVTKLVGPPQVSDSEWFADESLDVGLDVRAGVSWLLENEMGLCIEYRYSQFETDFEQGITDGTLSFNPSLQMHHLLFGITF